MTWHAVWKYLRTAPSLPTVRLRLDEVLAKFPKSKTYVDFLWRNVSTQATYAFTWELDYGFQASSIQEGDKIFDCSKVISFFPLFNTHLTQILTGIHATLKSNLRGVQLPFSRILSFFRKSLMRQKLTVDRKHSVSTIKTLLESASTAGFRDFQKHLTASLTSEGIKLTWEQFNRGFGYTIERLNNSLEIEKCLTISEKKRGPLGLRFRCLVKLSSGSSDEACKFIEGDYYKVMSRFINGSIDVVFINPSGNIACTCLSSILMHDLLAQFHLQISIPMSQVVQRFLTQNTAIHCCVRTLIVLLVISPFEAITKYPVFHHQASGFPSGIRFSPSIRFHEQRGFRPLLNRQLEYSLNIFALRRSSFHAHWMLCFASLMVVFSDIIASCFTT